MNADAIQHRPVPAWPPRAHVAPPAGGAFGVCGPAGLERATGQPPARGRPRLPPRSRRVLESRRVRGGLQHHPEHAIPGRLHRPPGRVRRPGRDEARGRGGLALTARPNRETPHDKGRKLAPCRFRGLRLGLHGPPGRSRTFATRLRLLRLRLRLSSLSLERCSPPRLPRGNRTGRWRRGPRVRRCGPFHRIRRRGPAAGRVASVPSETLRGARRQRPHRLARSHGRRASRRDRSGRGGHHRNRRRRDAVREHVAAAHKRSRGLRAWGTAGRTASGGSGGGCGSQRRIAPLRRTADRAAPFGAQTFAAGAVHPQSLGDDPATGDRRDFRLRHPADAGRLAQVIREALPRGDGQEHPGGDSGSAVREAPAASGTGAPSARHPRRTGGFFLRKPPPAPVQGAIPALGSAGSHSCDLFMVGGSFWGVQWRLGSRMPSTRRAFQARVAPLHSTAG